MAFDERGQADNLGRRIEICRRAYELLRQRLDFPASDIIFDPNVLTVATGLEEHRNYAAVSTKPRGGIKKNCPAHERTGGTVKFPFRFAEKKQCAKPCTQPFRIHAI